MKKNFLKHALIVLLVMMLAVTTGCGKKEKEEAAQPSAPTAQDKQAGPETSPGMEKPVIAPDWPGAQPEAPKDAAVSVDGIVLKKSDLDRQVQAKMKLFKDRIPADKKKEAQIGIRRQLKEEFVMRTLLTREIENKKIVATKQEVEAEMNQIRASLPPDKKVEDFLRDNQISRQDITLGVKIRKLVEKEAEGQAKPTAKEISKFYNENKDKFTSPESAHVRHILVTIDPKDDEKVKAEKKAKIEGLRKQLIEGADFAGIAKNYSDCPSKENGGDLGEIKKGQTVKPFEEAAFSQELKVIGPVVTTEYGYHIVQVLERKPGSAVKLEEVKGQIAKYLEQQKQAEVFAKMAARLKKGSAIIDYER
jgi:peptidyl-prolyl cis-trans isomerase C